VARGTGELAAARVRVRMRPLEPGVDPSAEVESVAGDAHPVAVFAIAHITDRDGDTIAIWVCDRVGRRTTIQRMAMRGDNIRQDAEVLELEAIELIRVSIAGLWPPAKLPSNPTSPAPAAAPAPPPPAALETAAGENAAGVASSASATPAQAAEGRRPELSVGLGVAGLRDAGGPSTEWMAALTARARWPGGLAAFASLAGLGPSVTLTGIGGSAALHRALGTAGGAWFFSSYGPLDAFVVAALGAARVEVAGAASSPTRVAHAGDAWAALGSAGPGAEIKLGRHVAVAVAADVVWAWSRLDVSIGETRTHALSRPGVLGTVGLQGSF